MAERNPPIDRAGIAGCVLAVVLGAAAVWAARGFSDLGAVFPRTIGSLLVVLGLAYTVLALRRRGASVAPLQGSGARRLGVALVMLAWGFALAPLGFAASSASAMALLLVLANHGRWTLRHALLYAGSAGLMLAAFYVLFKHALNVPLP
ncbi:MAG: tripartite tricarboxylate transporter TctB family protein [Rubrivivax sp.]